MVIESCDQKKKMDSINQLARANFNNNKWKESVKQAIKPSIMESLDSLSLVDENNSFESSLLLDEKNVIRKAISLEKSKVFCNADNPSSFLLIDNQEFIKVSSVEQFVQKLNCTNKDLKVKVVSIFGNTGDGKSHTLNQTFFEGKEVFQTSSEQNSCTLGVWAAFDAKLKVICLDTEGFLGLTNHENERTRMLLKVLAISDIVVYRTRSERLHKDMFNFLGAASRAYTHHFQSHLQAVGAREGVMNTVTALGPSVIIFHETRHTKPLSNTATESPEDILRDRFAQSDFEIEAYSSVKYVGVQTLNYPTDFDPFRKAMINDIKNTTVRSARKPYLVYNTLKIINDKFSGRIESPAADLFPDQYFTCPLKCYSCNCRCQNSMGHLKEGQPHHNDARCKYQHQYENLVYICKKCHSNGNEVIVTSRVQTHNDNSWYSLAKYAWSGYVIECPNCGEIYRSRQYWYGNQDPEDGAVRTEITHVWNLQANSAAVSQNTAQRVVDSVSYLSETVSNFSLHPAKALTSWVTDQVAPNYWRPNNEIKYCFKCHASFGTYETKHHCRACGEGFCASCSSKTKCVVERNWFTPVRVCDDCYENDNDSDSQEKITDDVSARKVSEHVVSTISAVGTVLNFSKSIIKDTARPSYWVPDSEIVNCCVCEVVFNDTTPLHHCRCCGGGVCHSCSKNRKSVPNRGWDIPVRVCDSCIKID